MWVARRWGGRCLKASQVLGFLCGVCMSSCAFLRSVSFFPLSYKTSLIGYLALGGTVRVYQCNELASRLKAAGMTPTKDKAGMENIEA